MQDYGFHFLRISATLQILAGQFTEETGVHAGQIQDHLNPVRLFQFIRLGFHDIAFKIPGRNGIQPAAQAFQHNLPVLNRFRRTTQVLTCHCFPGPVCSIIAPKLLQNGQAFSRRKIGICHKLLGLTGIQGDELAGGSHCFQNRQAPVCCRLSRCKAQQLLNFTVIQPTAENRGKHFLQHGQFRIAHDFPQQQFQLQA